MRALPVCRAGVLNRRVWEPITKYDSYGHEWVLRALFNGELLDGGRFPSLTLLMFVGLAHAIVRRRTGDRVAVLLFTMWLALYFGS